MRHFPLALYCAAVLALVTVAARAQSPPQGASYLAPMAYAERPPPPTEPSVVIAAKPAATTPVAAPTKPAAPKRAVRHEMAKRRWRAKGPIGPVTIPPPDTLVMMVRGTLAGLNQANFTGNYSVLHELATPTLQARVSATQFGNAFARLREQNIDLSPILVMPPHFVETPKLTPRGEMRVAGIFPSRPLQIHFAIDYRAVDGYWLIDALSVSALPAAPAATAGDVVRSRFGEAERAIRAAERPLQQARRPVRETELATLRYVPSDFYAPADLYAPSDFWPASLHRLVFGPSIRFAASAQ